MMLEIFAVAKFLCLYGNNHWTQLVPSPSLSEAGLIDVPEVMLENDVLYGT